MNHYSFSLVSKQKSDAEKLLARAEELLKEQDPDGNSGVKFDFFERGASFGIGDGSLVPTQADLAFNVISDVVATFPEMSLHYVETCNGPVCREAVSKNGELVDIEPWYVVVHMQDEEDYKQVVAYLQENTDIELTLISKRYSILWSFDGKTEDELTTEHLNELSRHFPKMLFQCYKSDGCSFEQGVVTFYTSFRGQEVEWEESRPNLQALMFWIYGMDVTHEDIIFNTEQVFQTALAKARADEDGYPHIVSAYLFFGRSLHSLVSEDFTWLKALAEHEFVPACCLILLGMELNISEREETFTDEDTGEEVKIIREEYIDGTIFEPDETLKKRLKQIIYEQAEYRHIGTNEIRWVCKYPLDKQPLLLMLVERGEEDAAEEIEDPTVLQELCDKGNKWAARQLYHKYAWGDEEHGFFINLNQAKAYYDMAGDAIEEWDQWDDKEDPGEEYPSTYKYTLTGDSDTLDGIETLIRDLCQRFGIPENEEDGLGLFVPQRQLIKVLVGSDTEFYRGNIQYLDREASDRLVITTESDHCEPLLYALRQCYGNLNVEMKKAE